ncbi:hypothetical protein OIO90_000861 [Microbotryomycetes sp. JL221]|nr:hypothetical protein OIO90_000861 [Microbotryomycetes sp. JL221]
MDSLGRLSDTLPGTEAAEKELQASFRSAALALTSLFKQGKKATTKAYIAGKQEALQDVLQFVQTSLDNPSAIDNNGGHLNVARLVDYICARQETLKAEEEGEDEDDTAAVPPQRPASAAARVSNINSSTRYSDDRGRTVPHSAPVTRAASTAPRDLSGNNMTTPVASTSSSVPSSPAFSRHSSHQSRGEFQLSDATAATMTFQPPSTASQPSGSGTQTPTTSHSATASVPLAAMSQATPLTRAQARKDRSSHSSGTTPSSKSRHRTSSATSTKDKTSRGTTAMLTGSMGPSFNNQGQVAVGVDGSHLGTAGQDVLQAATGMKRRWTNVSMTDIALDDEEVAADAVAGEASAGHDPSTNVKDSPTEDGVDDETSANEDGMEMEMDGWNGAGERPSKRIARTGLIR